MKIAVCVSHVPDTASNITIGEDKKVISNEGITFIINPYDEFAVEEALQLKEKLNAEEVIAISFGDDNNKETIRKALAMGADRGVLLKGDKNTDSFGIAEALANEIKEMGAEIVLFGKQSIDYDNSIIGQLTARKLNYHSVSVVVDLEIEGNNVKAVKEIEGGKETIETSLPVVITAQKGLNEPRYPSLKGIMASKRKPIDEKEISGTNNRTSVISMEKPAPKNPGRILGTDASAVPELIKLLREEAKVI